MQERIFTLSGHEGLQYSCEVVMPSIMEFAELICHWGALVALSSRTSICEYTWRLPLRTGQLLASMVVEHRAWVAALHVKFLAFARPLQEHLTPYRFAQT
jgi:hypothetical protein